MVYLGRDEILRASDLPAEDVAVPEWGGTVRVRGLTGAERDQFEGEILQGTGAQRRIDSTNLRARLVARCIVDETGQRLFSDEDIAALGQKNAQALDRLFAAAQRLNGMRQADVDELTKN